MTTRSGRAGPSADASAVDPDSDASAAPQPDHSGLRGVQVLGPMSTWSTLPGAWTVTAAGPKRCNIKHPNGTAMNISTEDCFTLHTAFKGVQLPSLTTEEQEPPRKQQRVAEPESTLYKGQLIALDPFLEGKLETHKVVSIGARGKKIMVQSVVVQEDAWTCDLEDAVIGAKQQTKIELDARRAKRKEAADAGPPASEAAKAPKAPKPTVPPATETTWESLIEALPVVTFVDAAKERRRTHAHTWRLLCSRFTCLSARCVGLLRARLRAR
jgi:hypothetical protein